MTGPAFAGRINPVPVESLLYRCTAMWSRQARAGPRFSLDATQRNRITAGLTKAGSISTGLQEFFACYVTFADRFDTCNNKTRFDALPFAGRRNPSIGCRSLPFGLEIKRR